jgi:hypothetical protein
MEDAKIILLNIRHYQALLKLDRHTQATRQRLIELLADAKVQLTLAKSVASSRNHQKNFLTVRQLLESFLCEYFPMADVDKFYS